MLALGRSVRLIPSALLALALVAVPGVAQAAFSASASAKATASTYVIPAPDPRSMVVAATCVAQNKNWDILVVGVTSFSPVPRANSHRLTVTDPGGTIQSDSAVSTAGGSYTNKIAAGGTWTYEIRAEYRVPGSTTVWTGKALTGTVMCPATVAG